jgi:RecA-family ATPase
MDSLNRVAAQIGNISLLIIDPIVNAVTGDMNKSNEVRRALQTFVDFAATHRCVVLGVSHFTKGSAGQNSAERILGSSAFKDFARTALVAVQDEETGECAMARAKTNIAVNSGGFSYRIESVHFPPDIETIRIIWGAQLEGSARSILSKYEKSSKEDAPKRHAAKQFLIEALNNGPAAANELIKHAREGYGITEDTLREAYAEIGMKPSRIGFGKGSVSMWSIPLATHV